MKVKKQTITIRVNSRNVRLAIYRPQKQHPKRPGILWLHGGGYASGMPEMFSITRARDLCKELGCVLVLPDYTLSWKAPFPAALLDAEAAFLWMQGHTDWLHINPEKIGIGGESAGGGLCAALCLWLRDTKQKQPAFQIPLYPMLSDTDTPSSADNHAPVWNTKRNHAAWKLYLKGNTQISKYAAPAREMDFSSLPACYTYFGKDEPFYDEDLAYVSALKKAGVPVRYDVYPDWYHAYDLMHPFSLPAKVAKRRFLSQVKKFLDS